MRLLSALLRIIYSLVGGLIVPALFWLGGYNFDVRGQTATYCAIFYMSAVVFIWLNIEVE